MCVAALHYSEMLSAGMWHECLDTTATLPQQGTPQLCMHKPQTSHFIVWMSVLVCVCVCVGGLQKHLHVDPTMVHFWTFKCTMTIWLILLNEEHSGNHTTLVLDNCHLNNPGQSKRLMQFKNTKMVRQTHRASSPTHPHWSEISLSAVRQDVEPVIVYTVCLSAWEDSRSSLKRQEC